MFIGCEYPLKNYGSIPCKGGHPCVNFSTLFWRSYPVATNPTTRRPFSPFNPGSKASTCRSPPPQKKKQYTPCGAFLCIICGPIVLDRTI